MEKDKKNFYNLILDCGVLYPFETLINGNVKECINVLKSMSKFAPIYLHDNLTEIKNNKLTKNKYQYIINQLKTN